MKQFGQKTAGKDYKDRPGSYALILREDGLIAATEERSSNKLHLPGGGIDSGETKEETLKREVWEEMVRQIKSLSFVGEAGQYADDTVNGDVNKVCSYYKVALIPGLDGEGDRVTRWVTPREFEALARHEAHVWAVKTFL